MSERGYLPSSSGGVVRVKTGLTDELERVTTERDHLQELIVGAAEVMQRQETEIETLRRQIAALRRTASEVGSPRRRSRFRRRTAKVPS